MKKQLFITLTLAALLTLFTGISAYAAEGEIRVNGTGIVMADPDTADIILSVETGGKTSGDAQKENNRILHAVTDTLLEMGIQKEDIVTAYSSVYPQYHYDEKNGTRSITGYRANTELQVTTTDIDNTGKYIDAALKAGATGTGGVRFSVSDQSKYYGQALQIAVGNAEKSARSIADAYGRALGAVKSVTEESRNAYHVEMASNMKTMAVEEAAADSAGGTTISYGKIQISANLSVVYSF